MITQADLTTISTVFGINTEDLSGALSSEEEKPLNLKLPGRVVTQEQEKELREAGVQQGKQLGYKEVAKSLQIQLDEGEKDPSKIAEKLKSSISTVMEEKYKNPDPPKELEEAKEALKSWENKYNKLLETHDKTSSVVKEWEEKYNGLQSNIKQAKRDDEIKKYLKDPEKAGLNYDQQLTLFKLDFDISEEEDQIVYINKNTKEKITNPVGKLETTENVVKQWLESQKFTKSRAGMGGKDTDPEGGTKVKGGLTPDQAYKKIKDQGIEPGSNEGLDLFKQYTAKT